MPAHIRQEPARRFGRAVRRDVVPAADPLDGGRRPRPGRVAGAPAGRRDRPFQRPRDLPQRPAENPAAPDQHHYLVIVFADQLADPLTGRDAAGSGIDLPASRHTCRHDTTPAGPGSAAGELLQPVFRPDRIQIRVHVAPAGPRRRPKLAFSPGRVAARPSSGRVSSPRSGNFWRFVSISGPQPPRNKRILRRGPDPGPRFFAPSSSGRPDPRKRPPSVCRKPRRRALRWPSLHAAKSPMPYPCGSRDRPTQAL